MGDSIREACLKAPYIQLPTEGCNWFYNSRIHTVTTEKTTWGEKKDTIIIILIYSDDKLLWERGI